MGYSRLLKSALVSVAMAANTYSAHAVLFELDYLGGIEGALNTTVTVGAAMRMQHRAEDLVGKSNLNPNVCFSNDQGGNNQQCQGTARDQIFPAQAAASSPGQSSTNFDDGNLNYDKYDLTQAVAKITQDLSLTAGDFGFFAKWLYFYDAVNNDFTENHPNRITRENRDSVLVTDNRRSNATLPGTIAVGAQVNNQRSDGRALEQIGTNLQLFDAYIYGALPLPGDKELSLKAGRHTLNWGESTVLLINSLNQVNPINVNNFTRVGFDLSELFQPTNMISASFEPFYNATLAGFYSLEWRPVEIPVPGSYFSFVDVGTPNIGDQVCICFGGGPESLERRLDLFAANGDVIESGRLMSPLDNPLSGLTPTSTTIFRLPDNEPSKKGQFGFQFKYYAEDFNNGTEIGFYYMNYHSQFPYSSFYATDASCGRAEGNDQGLDARNGPELLIACPDLPVAAAQQGRDPRLANSSAVPLDGVQLQLEYPEDLQLFGFSFNTTLGDWSIQGELAYRPDMPLQVDGEDLVFLGLGPTLSRCHDEAAGCSGSATALAPGVDGGEVAYGSSDFVPYPGTGITAYPDTFDLSIGHAVGSGRSFPSFIGAYRGIAAGEQTPVDRNLAMNSDNPGYIRGWEYFDVYQLNLGATYVQGSTDNFFGADQVIWLFEVGAQWVPDLPSTDVLQIEAWGTFNHASAGADGSMTGDYRQDCANTIDCHFGADGLRFNPHQQDHEGYADDFSAGYAVVALIRYESVLPGISLQPIIIFQHDVVGTSVDVANQFVEGRKDAIVLLETRYKEALSFNTGYTWFTGGGEYNNWRDRDTALFYIKYQF